QCRALRCRLARATAPSARGCVRADVRNSRACPGRPPPRNRHGPLPGSQSSALRCPLQSLDQAGVDQQAVEAAGLGAVLAAIEQPVAAFENLLLLRKSCIERKTRGLLHDE